MCGVTVCVIILSVSVTVCVYRKRQLNTKQESVQDPEPSKLSLDHPKREPVPEIDLDNFNIDNFMICQLARELPIIGSTNKFYV